MDITKKVYPDGGVMYVWGTSEYDRQLLEEMHRFITEWLAKEKSLTVRMELTARLGEIVAGLAQ